jgi:hypothetical protein
MLRFLVQGKGIHLGDGSVSNGHFSPAAARNAFSGNEREERVGTLEVDCGVESKGSGSAGLFSVAGVVFIMYFTVGMDGNTTV